MSLLLLSCLFSTFAMTGLIWLIQMVSYPLLARVGPDRFADYEQAHCRRISFVVLPLMLTELVTSLALAIRVPVELSADEAQQGLRVAAVLAVLIWVSTFALQVPAHHRLEAGFDQKTWQFLVRSNWIRTMLWTARSAILIWLLANHG